MKKQSFSTQAIAFSLAIAVLCSSCASTTVINSEPSGAKVYLNDEYVGTTPYTYSDTKIVGSASYVKLVKEGYNDFNTVLTRSEVADAGAIIGGLFVLVPFLWTMKYKPTHFYEMAPVSE